MKPAYLLVILGFLFSAALPAQSKCNPYCLITHPEPLSLAELNDYKSNYAAEYRKGLMMIKTHPVSVEFSRASILKFYETNFINSTKYDGINVFLYVFKSRIFLVISMTIKSDLPYIPHLLTAERIPEDLQFIITRLT